MTQPLPEWVGMRAHECYRDLAAGQLPIDDHHIVDWAATHADFFQFINYSDDELDEKLEEFCELVKEEEAKAKTIAEAAT